MPDLKLKLDSTGSLINPGDLTVGWLANVTWKIDDPRIGTFRIVGRDSNQKDPFWGKLDTKFKTEHSGTAVMVLKRDWEYKIEWKPAGTEEVKILDPKISVRPKAEALFFGAALVIILIPLTRFLIRRFAR